MRNPMLKLLAFACLLASPFSGCVNDGGTELPNEVRGTLYTASGAPAANATVTLYPVNYTPGSSTAKKSADPVKISVQTDASGRFAIKGASAGVYNVVATGDNLFAFQDSLALDGVVLDLEPDTLRVAGTLTGTVQLQPQHSPQAAIIQILGTDYYTNISADGRFSLTLPQGSYRLRVFTILADYVPLFVTVPVRSGKQDTLSDTLRPFYANIPVVSGITAVSDTFGIIKLKWKPTAYAAFQKYLVYRSITGSVSQGILIGSTSDTVFSDSVFPQNSSQNPGPNQFPFADTATHSFDYRVRILDLSDNLGPVFGSVSATAISPSKRFSSGRWKQALTNAPFNGNTVDYTKLIVFQDKMWAFNTLKKEVWNTADGLDWDLVGTLPLPAASRVVAALPFQGKIFAMVQKDPYQPQLANSLWASTNGTDWTLLTDSMPIPTYTDCKLLEFQNKIWVVAGATYSTMMGMMAGQSALYSSADGIQWANAAPTSAFRGGWLQGAVVFADQMWIIGANTYESFEFPAHLNPNAILSRSSNGGTWTAATFSSNAGAMLPRKGHAAVVHQGKIWVMGGIVIDSVDSYGSVKSKASPQVWNSENGTTWSLVDAIAPFGPRALLEAVSFHDKLWVIGGTQNLGNPYNSGVSPEIQTYQDIWYYE